MKARADLQAVCHRVYPVVQRQVEAHSHAFIWQMDKGLENSIFGTPIEKSKDATLTSDQVRRIARENGKSYSHACLAITPKVFALSSSIERLATAGLTLQEELNCFRSIVERLAILETALAKIPSTGGSFAIKSFDELIEIREIISTLIGTRFDWSNLQLVDFSEMPSNTDYHHNTDETRVSLSIKNILKHVDVAPNFYPA